MQPRLSSCVMFENLFPCLLAGNACHTRKALCRSPELRTVVSNGPTGCKCFPPVDRIGQACFPVTSSVRYPRLDLSRDTLSIRTIINETESNTLDAQLFFFFYARCQLN